ncbi:MAG: VPLPA-CTERM sorting domain-containing protein [Methylococcales bacterium]
MKTLHRYSAIAGLMTLSSLAMADIANNPDPYAAGFGFDQANEASWAGWTRGDAGTIYAEWDNFADASFGTATDRTAAPDVGSNGTSSAYLGWNAGTFRAGSGNLYSFSVTEEFNIALTTSTPISGPVTAALQIEAWGTPLNQQSLLLNGIAPTLITKTFTDPAFASSFGAVTLDQWQIVWNLPSASAAYNFNFASTEHSVSLAQVSVDIGVAPVPLPAAVWLFGSAMMGMLGLSRRKQLGSLFG